MQIAQLINDRVAALGVVSLSIQCNCLVAVALIARNEFECADQIVNSTLNIPTVETENVSNRRVLRN